MGRAQDDFRSTVMLERLLPARRAQTPLVTRLQPGETPLGMRRAQVIACGLRECKKCFGHDYTNRVHPFIVDTTLTTSRAIEACDRIARTQLQRLAEHIQRLCGLISRRGLLDHRVRLEKSIRELLTEPHRMEAAHQDCPPAIATTPYQWHR